MILVKKIQIPTLPTKKARRLYIYLPRDYERSDRRYPVLYMFDGHNVFYNSHATYGKSWGMKEYLEKSRLPIIVAAVECNHEGFRRLSEYSPWDFRERKIGDIEGLGKLTMEWITKTLKPEIDREFRTLPEREHTMIAGSSMGGVMSIYAAVEYNAFFSRAASLSPYLRVAPKAMRQMIKAHPLQKPTRVYIDMGGAEVKGRVRALTEIFELTGLLVKQGAEAAARVVPDGRHCEADWEKRIPVFMDYLLGDVLPE